MVSVSSSRPGVLSTCLLFASLLACGDDKSPGDDDVADGSTDGDTATETETDTGDLPGSCAEPIPPVLAADARLSADGSILRDALGRDVVMRGLNTGGRNKTPPYMPFPIGDDISLEELRTAADAYFLRMHDWGLDTVRLPFSWAALEPARDVWDEQYLDRYEVLVEAAWAAGLRVIIDFHQDIWSENFCGDGFPTRAVADPDAPWAECPDADWGLKYLTDADVRSSFDRFWANEDQLIDEFHDMWAKMADRFADHPGVVALELLNEPGWGTASDIQQWKSEVLEPFYDEAIPLVHDLAPDLLIVYDNPGIDAAGLDPNIYHPRPAGDYLIYGPHLYGAAIFGSGGPNPLTPITRYADFGRDSQVPVLLGEFGFQPHEEDGPDWMGLVGLGLDEQRMSATMWEYSVNEALWNYENFSMVDGAGDEQLMLDTWVRPWLRAVAGSEPSFIWVEDIGTAQWVSDGGVTEIVLPPRLFAEGAGSLDITGEGACFTRDQARGELRVQAPAGATVSVLITLP
ncbi:MAG: cellulase family glycosylhydrolase [Myxococcales bacterium]|nr:cellulase family glycosylhydrolase [Myxococcales bacterium]